MGLLSEDPVRFQVLSSAFMGIADEMTALIHNVAFSLVVSEGRDASASLCARNGDHVASGAADIPAHLGTHPFSIKGMFDWMGATEPEDFLEPGDIMIMNDAYIGGTHNNDVRVIMPVFVGDRVVAFLANSAHWPDIGGHVPGTFDPNAKSSHGEGLIIPPCHIVERGTLNREFARVILRNVRVADTAYGDLLAQIGAVRLGERRFQEMCDAYGADVLVQAMEEMIQYSESLMRAEFAKLPDGQWSTVSLSDRDPGVPDSEPVAVRMTLTISGDSAVYDFAASDGPAKGAINGPISCTISSAIAATKCIFPHIPMNQGIARAIEFRFAPEASVVSAEYPSPISGMAATIFPHVANCVFKTFIEIIPERCMAGPTGLSNIVWGGSDLRDADAKEYVCYLWLEGGWGGRPARRDNSTAMTIFATGARNQPVELHERSAPFVFDCYELQPDSGGPGSSRGSNGVTRRWYVTHGEATLSCLGDGGRFGPWGFAGGKDAPANLFMYAKGTDDEVDIGMVATGLPIRAGQMLEYRQAGGGGYGDPLMREIAWVVEDVVEGYVTLEGARRDYGVVVEQTEDGFAVDEQATSTLRRERGEEG